MKNIIQIEITQGSDYPRQRYENLRFAHSNSREYTKYDFTVRFFLFGFYGLFFTCDSQEYTTECYHAPFFHWCGKMDPALEVLHDAYRQIVFTTKDKAI